MLMDSTANKIQMLMLKLRIQNCALNKLLIKKHVIQLLCGWLFKMWNAECGL